MVMVSLNISIDTEIKTQVLFADLGMELSTTVNIFLRQAIRENGIPFKKTRERPNAVTVSVLRDSIEGRDLHGPYDSSEEMMEDLNA